MFAAQAQLAGPGLADVDVPWEPVTAVTALCVVLTVLAAALPASRIKEETIPRT